MGNHSAPAPGVAFRDLNVFGQYPGDTFQQSAASLILTIPQKLLSLLQWRITPRSHILHDFNGVVGRGDMVLVLGRPGSGCSTFLKALTGDMPGLHIDRSSKILYNGASETTSRCYREPIDSVNRIVPYPQATTRSCYLPGRARRALSGTGFGTDT